MPSQSKRKIQIINGPNLNLLGKRQIEIYGSETFPEYFKKLEDEFDQFSLLEYQSNHEGDIIDKLHKVGFTYDGIILNAGGYSHTSIAIRDAISSIPCPVVEVHISDIYNREDFRKISFLTEVCILSIVGEGLDGYKRAIQHFL